jgi:hypothetical protein
MHRKEQTAATELEKLPLQNRNSSSEKKNFFLAKISKILTGQSQKVR